MLSQTPRWQSEIIDFVIEIGKVIISDWDWPNNDHFETLYDCKKPFPTKESQEEVVFILKTTKSLDDMWMWNMLGILIHYGAAQNFLK